MISIWSKIPEESFCKDGDIVIADASEDYDDIGKTIELKNIGNERIVAGLHTILARDTKNVIYNGYAGYMFVNVKDFTPSGSRLPLLEF